MNKTEIIKKWNKLHWLSKSIIEAFVIGLIIYILISLLNLIPSFKNNFQMPWLYFFIALIIIAIIFQLIEKRLSQR